MNIVSTLSTRLDSTRLGLFGPSLQDLFKSPYCKYINNYTKSTDAISALHEDNTAFVRFLKQCRRNPAWRYILFLQDYAKCAPEDPVLKGELALALLEMQKLASVLNESKRASENIQAMLARTYQTRGGRRAILTSIAHSHSLTHSLGVDGCSI